MARRRAAGLLLALAACFATANAAPTASNHTSLDLYDGAPEGCYYNFQHYGEGDRIMTNEPCLNCTCHNRMLMCYLKVCPFTKPIGQDCTIEKRADQCCPIVTCPDVPVDLLTSTTTSPAEYGPTGIGKLDKFGCSINGKYFPEGSKVPPSPNKPCEHCYCIRNMTTCVMQECTLHVDGCTPIYHKDVCCPVRYSCDHPEDEMPLLDDLSTTVRPTPGFLLTTTTVAPVTQLSQDCVYENQIFPDGALIKTEKACDHCYCMKGDIVCVVQECGTPMENEGKNCTALPPREGVCCPDTYICEGDEPTTATIDAYDRSTNSAQEDITTLVPPRRTSSEGSGYRHDDESYTEMPGLEPQIEGSGEEEYIKPEQEMKPETSTSAHTDDILGITEEAHEYIPLTTSQSYAVPEATTVGFNEGEDRVTSNDIVNAEGSQSTTPGNVEEITVKESNEEVTEVPQSHEIGTSETVDKTTDDTVTTTNTAPMSEGHEVIHDITTSPTPKKDDSLEPLSPITSGPFEDKEKTDVTVVPDVTIDDDVKSTSPSVIDHDITSSSDNVDTEYPHGFTESIDISKSTTEHAPIIGSEDTIATEQTDFSKIPDVPSTDVSQGDVDLQGHEITSSAPNTDDEYVTTETEDKDFATTESSQKTEISEPPKHITTNTPMLEEIEKDTPEYNGNEQTSSGVTQDDSSNIFSTTPAHILSVDEKFTTVNEEPPSTEDATAKYDDYETTPSEAHKIQEHLTESSVVVQESSTPVSQDTEKGVEATDDKDTTVGTSDIEDVSQTTTVSALETEGDTTEPDKGLNTIPGTLEEDISDSGEKHKTTIVDEKLTTKSELDNRFGDDIGPVTTQASSQDNVEPFTESTYHKDDRQTTIYTQESSDLTTIKPDIPLDQMTTLVNDYTKTTESSLDAQQEIASTTLPVDITTEDIALTKGDAIVPTSQSYTPEPTVIEKEITPKEETATTTHIDYLTQTTEANQEDNEIFDGPRIPGEGDCLLNGITYTNESAVPSSNKCQSGCKCISSIIKCDPILCSLPPEMDNCQTIYDSPDACCPTYVCDHKSETNPPQSHSQMSGTESPIDSPITCHGDECTINIDKMDHKKQSSDCKSGICPGYTDGLGDDSTVTEIPKKPLPDQKQECVGDECGPVKCTSEDGCQETTCEGDNCNITPAISSETPQCAGNGDCSNQNIPTKDCSSGDCVTESQSDDTKTKEPCNTEGCENVPDIIVPTLDQNPSEQCSGTDCQTQMNIETSTASILEHTSALEKESDKTTTDFTESLDRQETSTIPSDHKHTTTSELSPEEKPLTEPTKLTTSSDQIDVLPNSDLEPQNVDDNKPGVEEEFSTEEPETASDRGESSITPGIISEEKATQTSVLDEISSELPETNISTDDAQKLSEDTTKEPEELPTSTSGTIKEEIVTASPPDSTEKSNDETNLIEPSINVTPDTNEEASHSTQLYDHNATTEEPIVNTEESLVDTQNRDTLEAEPTKPQDITQPQGTTINYDQTTKTYQEENITSGDSESGTEPTSILVTDDSVSITEHKETTMNIMEGSSTESATLSEKVEDFTSAPTLSEKESTTVKELHDLPTHEVTESSEETSTQSPKLDVTDSLDIAQITEKTGDVPVISDTKLPTDDGTPLQEYSTQSPKTDDITTELPEISTTSLITEEAYSEPPKSDDATQAISADGERKETTPKIVNEIATELPQTDITVPAEGSVSSESSIGTELGSVDMKVTESDRDVSVSSENVYQDVTTSKIQEELMTEAPKTSDTEPQSPEDAENGFSTEKLQEHATESSKPLETESHEATTVEEYQKSTTSKLFDESSTELPKTETQTPEIENEPTKAPSADIDVDIDVDIDSSTTQSILTDTEIQTSKPTATESSTAEEEQPDITTSQDVTQKSIETTPSTPSLDGSRRTESEAFEPEKITTKLPHDSDSGAVTDINEQRTTTTLPEIINGGETTIAAIVGSEQPQEETTPFDLDSDKKLESDAYVTTLKPIIEESVEPQTDTQETISTRPQPMDTIPEDSLKTTTLEKQDITTSKPIETPETEDKTENPMNYTPKEDSIVSQELSTETIKSEDTEGTELPSVVTSSMLEPITEKSPTSSDKPTEESTSEIENKFSSDIYTDTTKPHSVESVTTDQPHEIDFTKIEDNVQESAATETDKNMERSTEPADIEKDTEVPIQVSTAEAEQKVELTSPSSKQPDVESTESQEFITTSGYEKPIEEGENTEVTTTVDQTTPKAHLPDEVITSDVTSEPEEPEPSTTVKLPIQETTITPVSSNTDTHTYDDNQNKPIETLVTTETPEVIITSKPEPTESDVTESQTEETKPYVFDIPETSSPSSSTDEVVDIEKQTTVPDEHHAVSPDIITTESSESIDNEPSLATTILLPDHELSSSTSSPLEDTEQTVKEHDAISSNEYTTASSRLPDSSDVSQPSDVDTEKQSESISTATPEPEAPIEDNLTTKPPLKPDQFETTFESTPASDLTAEVSTITSSPDIVQTTAMEHVAPEQEQSVPVSISDLEKTTLYPKESESVQTERITQPTEKPLHEVTPPEEEFLLATSKAPTTTKAEEEVPTSPAYVQSTVKPTEKPAEPITTAPEAPKPIPTDVQATDELPGPEEDGPFPPSGPTSGYGSEPDYVEEDQTFGPGTCRYGGKVYVSAQQIPRDDPCDFCFCFRSDIICLQQSCPPPIHGCHEEPIQGFCCPRYECPVSMATTVNVTTTTTTTTTTLPPHFPTHSYKGSAQRRGCQIKGQIYKVGEVVRASSGPCLHCTCGGDGQMKCDPKVCTPEPMLRQMIAAAVSAKRRR